MSRAELAARQAALVAALVSGGEVPCSLHCVGLQLESWCSWPAEHITAGPSLDPGHLISGKESVEVDVGQLAAQPVTFGRICAGHPQHLQGQAPTQLLDLGICHWGADLQLLELCAPLPHGYVPGGAAACCAYLS
jgi:hypothetical protein